MNSNYSINNVQRNILVNELVVEKKYWTDKIFDYNRTTKFPEDNEVVNEQIFAIENFEITKEFSLDILKIANYDNLNVFTILLSNLFILLKKYNDQNDLIIRSGIFNSQTNNEFINRYSFFRQNIDDSKKFKEFITIVKSEVNDVIKYQNYPIDILISKVEESNKIISNNIDITLTLKNAQEDFDIEKSNAKLSMSIEIRNDVIVGYIKYLKNCYEEETIKNIKECFVKLLCETESNLNLPISAIKILSQKMKNQLLLDFNNTIVEYSSLSIVDLFKKQVLATPNNIAIKFRNETFTYVELSKKVNHLANYLANCGIKEGNVVGVFMERGSDTMISILAILEIGAAYLPIDLGTPQDRINIMLKNAEVKFLLTKKEALKDFKYLLIQNIEINEYKIIKTPLRSPIRNLDSLPIPDRSFIDINKYINKIGMASVSDCISLLTTRGCPYKCIYCHKVWSKEHYRRSAENLFCEIEYFHKQGIKRFAIIDDCFNLDLKKSIELFKLIIKNKFDIQLFFPNGLRGDLLTPEYIDLMIEAGTKGINLSLETASPRLQKLLKKDLNLDKFYNVVDYIATKHSNIILELASMHGFPTETEDEAMLTLNFIKSIKWIHFPYIHILKIYPNTEMEELALQNGISKESIIQSKDRAYHELPETLPFPKSFTKMYQADFLNNYFLQKDRLAEVLPVQMKILNEDALIQKYNAYLPTNISSINDLRKFTGLEEIIENSYLIKKEETPIILNNKLNISKSNGKKLLLLDLSQHFSDTDMLYNVSEQPIGLISLMTYISKIYGDKINGRIYKSGIDFNSFSELGELLKEFTPDLIGIRTLTYFQDFFHETVSFIKQIGIDAPIITGGPYATSDYNSILKDINIDIVLIGEGEETFAELLDHMFNNDFKIPSKNILNNIKSIVYRESDIIEDHSRNIIYYDYYDKFDFREKEKISLNPIHPESLAYVMFTSGTTGIPKGVMIEHRQIMNCLSWMQEAFRLNASDKIIHRTNLSFDPSVYEMFLPLTIGASVHIIDESNSRNADFLIDLLANNKDITLMYCPSSLLTAMAYILNNRNYKTPIKIPYFLIGAESISRTVIDNMYNYLDGKIYNTYGPTEGTINNTYIEIDRNDTRDFVPIGKPIFNNNIFILSSQKELLPINVPGEIYIGGDSVGRGYINDTMETQKRFMTDFMGKNRVYRTGDIGKWLSDGNIEFIGRVDEQVKLRGYRIELGEIEKAIKNHPTIIDCIVKVSTKKNKIKVVNECKICGITSSFPGVTIHEDGTCNICEFYSSKKSLISEYFKNQEDLKLIIKNTIKESEFDCILLYSGGKASAYALYKLVELGVKVLTITYDNGYFTPKQIENIKYITSQLGVPNIVLTHDNSDMILRESMYIAATVCRGCFHTSFSLAAKYAYDHKIKIVIGATLSRGQILENKVQMHLLSGITDIDLIEDEILKIQKVLPTIDKRIYDQININEVTDGRIYEKVKFIDFYRFIDVSNKEMISYLVSRDKFWDDKKNNAIYSTKCPVKLIGDFGHMEEKGFHYYGSATSWEKRINHIKIENVKEDLHCSITSTVYNNFMKRIGYYKKNLNEIDKILTAYVLVDKPEENTIDKLKEYLPTKLPKHMIPSNYMILETFPIGLNGKIDKKELPEPISLNNKNKVLPKTDTEKLIANIWKQFLNTEEFDINENFFELGGNSLNIIMVTNKLKELNINVPVVQFFQFPTISAIANFIDNNKRETTEVIIDKGNNRSENIVSLDEKILHATTSPVNDSDHIWIKRSSSKVKIFVFHDGYGNIAGYFDLFKNFSIEVSIIGINCPLQKQIPVNITIEDLVKEYVDIMTNINETDDFFLLGWSLGGLIAYESAIQLEKLNKKVKYLGLIDAVPHKNEKIDEFNPKNELAYLRKYELLDIQEERNDYRTLKDLWENIHISNNGINKLLLEQIPIYAETIRNMSKDELVIKLNQNRSLNRAATNYLINKKINSNIYNYFVSSQLSSFWNNYTSGNHFSYQLVGDHFSIMNDPHVNKLRNILLDDLTNQINQY